jgi:hypothetical protein
VSDFDTFDSATAVPGLAYDFTAHGGSKGIIPEPSDVDLKEFGKALAEMASEVLDDEEGEESGENGEEKPKPSRVERIRDAIAMTEELNEKGLAAIVAVCHGTPPREEITALPGRIQRAFSGWLVGKLLDPQLPNAGTRGLRAVV